MCCSCRACALCFCLILILIVIGVFFGFGVYKDGFHKIKDVFNACDPTVAGAICGNRPFIAYPPAPPSPY